VARSIRQLDRPTDLASPLSFYNGHLGVAYTVHRVGKLTGDDVVCAQGLAILDRLNETIDVPHPLDLLGGSAGAIPVLLDLCRSTGRVQERDLAIALGVELCRTATVRNSVWTWDADLATGPGTGSVPLTGMSHGASGIALALLELNAATGRSEFLTAARGAFAYEDSLFNPNLGNWPDLRGKQKPEEPGKPLTFARTWCHGAPGIALARLRASVLDPEQAEEHLGMAGAAIDTTLSAIDKNIAIPGQDASLCHGLAGLLDVVLIAFQLLNEPSYLDRAVAAAKFLIERHASACDYPSGLVSRGPNPSLMLGLAGIGYSFLRLHHPIDVPSVLFPGSSLSTRIGRRCT
jgi:lantibiotic modifying enzyme